VGARARVKKIAEGAALMSETTVEIKQLSGDANLVGNRRWKRRCSANLMARAAPASTPPTTPSRRSSRRP
jgi:aminobenzoyl-glutamate utilization protein B